MAGSVLPEKINRLDELAHNLWWSWHPQARNIFRSLDYQLWKASGHNPVKQLEMVEPSLLQAAASDLSFLQLYDFVMKEYDDQIKCINTWYQKNYMKEISGPIAFFSMEYAIHNSLPFYAGGLGILAGDYCKEASDLGMPVVAVGFMYPQGYFHQHLCADTNYCQREIYEEINFEVAPIQKVTLPDGSTTITHIKLGDVTVSIGVWLLKTGCVSIYLLDTDLEENPEPVRNLASRLYIADREIRIQQEIILGFGGVQVLRKLNINPVLWHANEGHTAFMMLERIRELLATGNYTIRQAIDAVKSTTVFTTHTPVKAGHDVFSEEMVNRYLDYYLQQLNVSRQTFYGFIRNPKEPDTSLNMTVLSIKSSSLTNAVSALHEPVTRNMWRHLYPNLTEEQLPFLHITNGTHLPTWIAPELYHLFSKYFGENWINYHDDPQIWQQIDQIPDNELWSVHQQLKMKLNSTIHHRARKRWLEHDLTAEELPATGTLLDTEALTIVFARRFASYKRPTLVFSDTERLRKILTNPIRPVQIIFAGKSHPADLISKHLLQKVYNATNDPQFEGRLAFIENYDMHMARYLVHGADVWLNVPRRLQEASGTSGMKAAINGALNLSVPDGWWYEAYNGKNGWSINDASLSGSNEEEDARDAEELYRLLEDEVVPLYYRRDRRRIPHEWLRMVRETIRSIAPVFCTRRMVKEYTLKMYLPAVRHEKPNP